MQTQRHQANNMKKIQQSIENQVHLQSQQTASNCALSLVSQHESARIAMFSLPRTAIAFFYFKCIRLTECINLAWCQESMLC